MTQPMESFQNMPPLMWLLRVWVGQVNDRIVLWLMPPPAAQHGPLHLWCHCHPGWREPINSYSTHTVHLQSKRGILNSISLWELFYLVVFSAMHLEYWLQGGAWYGNSHNSLSNLGEKVFPWTVPSGVVYCICKQGLILERHTTTKHNPATKSPQKHAFYIVPGFFSTSTTPKLIDCQMPSTS